MADPTLTNTSAQILWIQATHLIRLDKDVAVPILADDIPPAAAAITGAFAPQVADGTLVIFVPVDAPAGTLTTYTPPPPPPPPYVCIPAPVPTPTPVPPPTDPAPTDPPLTARPSRRPA
jgi:hypothetical protein